MNFTELQANVASAMGRDDVPVYVYELATSQLNRDLYTLDSQTETTIAASGELTPMPVDYRKMESAYLDLPTRIQLEAFTANALNYRRRDSGTPWAYAIVNDADTNLPQLKLISSPDGEYDVFMRYYTEIAALTELVTTNVVLSRYPDLYMYGSMYQAGVWAQDDGLAGSYKTLYDLALEATETSELERAVSGPVFQRSGTDLSW